jgi:uncharacterized protein
MSSSALSELCVGCGLCCDGTLFRHVKITGSEREDLVKLGIGVGEKRGGDVMWLPCGKLDGTCCTIYEARPGGCRAFICALGSRLVAKQVSAEAARAEVEEMQRRLEALKRVLPPGEGPVLRRAREHIDSTTALVTEEQLRAFQRVEDQRYAVFMPPPG